MLAAVVRDLYYGCTSTCTRATISQTPIHQTKLHPPGPSTVFRYVKKWTSFWFYHYFTVFSFAFSSNFRIIYGHCSLLRYYCYLKLLGNNYISKIKINYVNLKIWLSFFQRYYFWSANFWMEPNARTCPQLKSLLLFICIQCHCYSHHTFYMSIIFGDVGLFWFQSISWLINAVLTVCWTIKGPDILWLRLMPVYNVIVLQRRVINYERTSPWCVSPIEGII